MSKRDQRKKGAGRRQKVHQRKDKCCACEQEFNRSELSPMFKDEDELICKACAQDHSVSYNAFLQELGLAPRQLARLEILSFMLLQARGWEVRPDLHVSNKQAKLLTDAETELLAKRAADQKLAFEKVVADFPPNILDEESLADLAKKQCPTEIWVVDQLGFRPNPKGLASIARQLRGWSETENDAEKKVAFTVIAKLLDNLREFNS